LIYKCDIPGLEDNFIELSDSWSRKEVRSFWELKDDVYLALLQSKLIACHLARPGDTPITEPVAFTAEVLDTLDWRIVRWASTVPVAHVQALGELGEALGRRLFGSTAEPVHDAPTKLPTDGS
jgi:hypothetical protein